MWQSFFLKENKHVCSFFVFCFDKDVCNVKSSKRLVPFLPSYKSPDFIISFYKHVLQEGRKRQFLFTNPSNSGRRLKATVIFFLQKLLDLEEAAWSAEGSSLEEEEPACPVISKSASDDLFPCLRNYVFND